MKVNGNQPYGWRRTVCPDHHAYDAASRLASVTDHAGGTPRSATYSYVDNSALVGQIDFAANGTSVMSIVKQYDYLNRLTGISASNTQSSAILNSFGYSYNSANQRTNAAVTDNSHWVYTYDSLGQVISGKKYWPDGTPVAGQQFEYTFDDIGNRKTAGSGGNNSGGNLRYQNYTANTLNQYSRRTVPGYVDSLGLANSNATVTLWGSDGSYAPAWRHGEYFAGELAVANSAGALWLTITNLAVLNDGTNADIVTNMVGNAFLPRTPETYGYDPDGNLTNDGRWALTWDAENRLTKMESLGGVAAASLYRLEFAYDAQGRRIQKIAYTNNSSVYLPQSTNRFVYDGWNLIAVLSPQPAILRSFAWGLDLSGSLQGAGGVGGLLTVFDSSTLNNQPSTHFAAYDGNGNVSALVSASDGSVSAQYEYGPFGELLRATGPMAKANPFRFSTKYQDDETDLLYYGLRYYNASTGRWNSKDPIQEEGGLNIYGFVSNDPLDKTDKLGLFSNTTPGVPHVSNDRHNNYLIFYATCPRGWSVTAVTVTYDSAAMANGMLTGGASDERRQWLLNYTYGGLKDVGFSNCLGDPVEVQAYMRTRLVSPGLQFALWRAANGLPSADDILALYVANTQIHWLCNNCCGRGTSTR